MSKKIPAAWQSTYDLLNEKVWPVFHNSIDVEIILQLIEQVGRLEDEIATLSRVVDQDMDDFVDLSQYWNGGSEVAAVDACEHAREVAGEAVVRHEKLRMDKMVEMTGTKVSDAHS